MDIFQVVGALVCTHRHPGLGTLPLRLVRDQKGKLQVAVDTIGSRSGSWVFATSGSAARMALDDKSLLTDLTIGGIIDNWEQQIELTHSSSVGQPATKGNESKTH